MAARVRVPSREYFRVTRLLALPLAFVGCTSVPSPHRLTEPGIAPAVWGVLEIPSSPGPHPGVILLPGASGWHRDHARFARTFADSGFVALAIDYAAETGRASTPDEAIRNWATWQATVRNAVTFLKATPAVAGRPIGLVGYSRGAFLAISMADSAPAIGAIVDFYGAGSDDDPPSDHISHFPPLLILHGDADREVPVALAYRLYDRIRAHGGEVEMHLYPGAGHGFNAPWAPSYSESAATDAWQRTIAFLRRQLKG